MSQPKQSPEARSQRPKEGVVNPQKKKARGRVFAKGVSGNPAGRPRGSHNKSTLLALQVIEGQAEVLSRKVIEMALEGESSALRLCLERLVSVRRDRAIQLDLAPITSFQELAAGLAAVLNAVAKGELTPEEGQKMAVLIEQHSKVLETADLEHRVAQLEKGMDR